jgi:ribosomal protein S17E
MIGRVYKIVCSQSDDVYVGSTFNELRIRWKQHKFAKTNRCAITPLLEKYDVSSFKIVLIKLYEVVDRKHLQAYEQLWISKLRCINKNNPFRIEWLSKKDYYQRNRNKILEYYSQYAQDNKERVSGYKTKYNQKHEEERKAKIHCAVCKYDVIQRDLKRHESSARHQANLIEYHEPTHEKKIRCEVCDVEITRLKCHEKSARHQQNLRSA